jgi:hypothetical protein
MPKVQFSIARKFMLQPLRRYNVKATEKPTNNLHNQTLLAEVLIPMRTEKCQYGGFCSGVRRFTQSAAANHWQSANAHAAICHITSFVLIFKSKLFQALYLLIVLYVLSLVLPFTVEVDHSSQRHIQNSPRWVFPHLGKIYMCTSAENIGLPTLLPALFISTHTVILQTKHLLHALLNHKEMWLFPAFPSRARICKRLRSPGIDSK